MARHSVSISAWKCSYAVLFTPTCLNGVAGYLSPNFGTTLQLTQLWVILHLRFYMGIHHDTLG